MTYKNIAIGYYWETKVPDVLERITSVFDLISVTLSAWI